MFIFRALLTYLLSLTVSTLTWSADIIIEAEGFKSLEGHAIILVYAEADKASWPDDESAATCKISPSVNKKVMTGVCSAVSPGVYAVTVVHDKNSNNTLDHGIFGPSEAYGFSNNKRAWLKPPSFEQCSFEVAETAVEVSIKLK